MSSLEKCLFRSSTYFFFHIFFDVVCFVLNCMSCLYILEINLSSVASCANIFSHSEGCLFLLFTVSFVMQKLLSLFRSHVLTFVFIKIILGGGSERILL